jgi:hypothetical protein
MKQKARAGVRPLHVERAGSEQEEALKVFDRLSQRT